MSNIYSQIIAEEFTTLAEAVAWTNERLRAIPMVISSKITARQDSTNRSSYMAFIIYKVKND